MILKNNINMLLGRKIKKSREEQGVLQRQLAALLDIDTPMFSKIERGERRAKREQVIKIAEYLHQDETELLSSRPLKSPFLRDIVQVQYLAYFLKHAQKSFHRSSEVICCCREKYVHSISYHTLIKVAAQTIIRL